MFSRSMYFFSCVAISSLIAGASQASVYVVDQRNDNDGAVPTFFGYTTALTTIGQSFAPTFDDLDHVELYVRAANQGFSSEVHIDIMESPEGAILGSSSSQIVDDSFVLRHFHFTPIAISEYESLFIRVVEDFGNLETQAHASAFLSGGFDDDDYAGGAAYADGVTGGDLWFRTGSTSGSTVTTTTLPMRLCGDTDGGGVTATDALRTLQAAVGLPTSCELCVCDVDSSGAINATDSLRVLQEAVGIQVDLNCVACG